MFEEQAAQTQWAQASSEEESPFGVPEPVITPPVVSEPEVVMAAQEEIASQEPAIAADVLSESAISTEEPVVAEETGPISEETYDDTWPGVILQSGQPVEELFEAESAPAVHGLAEEKPVTAPDVTPVDAAENGRPLQITDELVDKIAERVVTKLSERLVSEIVWQVVPDLAEKMIRRELEKLHAGEE